MYKIKYFYSLSIFLISLILISYIKNQTGFIEKKITKFEIKITKMEKNLYESQLDFYYLSSPEYLSEMISKMSMDSYYPMMHSDIYLSYNQYLIEKSKSTKKFENEKKN